MFPGKSFFSAHEVSTCKISGCLSYRILDSGPDGTQTTLTLQLIVDNIYDVIAISPNLFIFNDKIMIKPLFPHNYIRFGLRK